jgi:hypothetical protein
MSIARLSRDRKRQLGQFLTPSDTAASIVRNVGLLPDAKILEPSFGEGAFIFEVLASVQASIPRNELGSWCENHLYGCELDDGAYAKFTAAWESRGLGLVPHTLERCDFFRWMPPGCHRSAATHRRQYFTSSLEQFDLVIGNPPFGGSIDPSIQDELDAIFGVRDGRKIKKETYAFFIVKGIDLLKPGGKLVYVCSDTILTIPTMTGLRSWLQSNCDVHISEVPGVFSDTNQKMLVLTLTKQLTLTSRVSVLGKEIPLAEIEATPNLSWRVDSSLAQYFTGVTLGDRMVATSGMTIGKNELFLRPIKKGRIEEIYEFAYGEQKITVEREISRARLGNVCPRRLRELRELEALDAMERVVTWERLKKPKLIALPHDDYRFYNKATSRIVYADPEWVIFWRGNGDYVYTFKKTGNWYLHGVGGMKYFGREGLAWSLIAPRIYARYLPAGYILDSGAPCAFLRPGVEDEELFFILGWTLTELCTQILKGVINHTRNIQSKDFERLPYPAWVDAPSKQRAVGAVRGLVARAKAGEVFSFDSYEVRELNFLYEWRDRRKDSTLRRTRASRQMAMFR